jgi:hypothetical protein
MIGIVNILIVVILVLLLINSCRSVTYIKSEVPDLDLTPITVPSISKDSAIWNQSEFVLMVDYAEKLEIQLDAYKKYIQTLNK